MLADMADQPALYQPTEFWKAASASIMDELNQEGFANFRSLSSARSYFALIWTPGKYDVAGGRACIEKLLLESNSRKHKTARGRAHCEQEMRRRAPQDCGIVTSACEVNCFPSTALDSHFGTLSFIRRIPESLKDRILVVIRTKPGLLGDNPILYRELCGFPLESLTFLDGLDFSQSVSVADCVVGINLPTSGYFEVLRKGVPLIHVQTADVISLQPDLPPEIVQRITELQGIWPTIEAVLFDEQQRRKILETQGKFVAADFRPAVSGREIPSKHVFGNSLALGFVRP